MNATAAIGIALLKGEILTIKTAFNLFSTTNLPREISRAIEKPFGLHISRIKCTGKSKYGIDCWWYEYRLNKILPDNQEGIKKLRTYVEKHSIKPSSKSIQLQQELFI